MAAQVVWRVTDTAQALFEMSMITDEFRRRPDRSGGAFDRFTAIPMTISNISKITLRGNHEEVGDRNCAPP